MLMLLIPIGFVVFAILFYARVTDPFTANNIINKQIVSISKKGKVFFVSFIDKPKIRSSIIAKTAAYVKAGTHIILSRFWFDEKAKSTTVSSIVDEINAMRFDPSNHFLISGDHFSMLYPRSLGIFYHSLLDPRIKRTRGLWEQQQSLYLKTTAYALYVFRKAGNLATTVVPVGRRSVTLANIYAPPSDTLYSLLYALKHLSTSTLHQKRYPFKKKPLYTLQTKHATQYLLKIFTPMLKKQLSQFEQRIVDCKTGLVKTDILLSGSKDIAKRSSAFYDNVMLWKTMQLANELGIVKNTHAYKTRSQELKSLILKTFFLPKKGYFLEDLSEESLQISQYSSDWLIAVQTGFLDPKIKHERIMLERIVQHIDSKRIDQPFGLRYQNNFAPHKLYIPVRIGASSYGSIAIWSHWGMEYIKLLAMLYSQTGKKQYIHRAREQLSSYEKNIVLHKGFPEVYDEKGNFYKHIAYKSVRKTGWVVNFQQAREMVNNSL